MVYLYDVKNLYIEKIRRFMNILLILGHPNQESFCNALLEQYAQGANQANIQILRLGNLEFNPISQGYAKPLPLEPDLITAQQQIAWADHLVFIYPTWWGSTPALLQGFIDRTFLPGFAFKYKKDSIWWDRLLTGKSARIITTMDGTSWWHYLMHFAPGINSLKRAVLHFCGVKTVKTTIIESIRRSSLEQRQKYLEQIKNLGARDAKNFVHHTKQTSIRA
jgi:NAD(P)H dehydrogenase (quinone)